MKEQNHFICTGECEGVSKTPGICQAVECDKYNQKLTPCTCSDGEHNDLTEESSDEDED